MDKDRITYLCERYLSDSAIEEELKELERAFRDPLLEEALKAVLTKVYTEFPKDKYADLDPETAEKIFSRIDIRIGRKTTVALWPRIIAAASVIMLVAAATLFYTAKKDKKVDGQSIVQYANDVPPGKQGATLTLASGKKLKLSDVSNTELFKQTGIKMTKTKDGKLVYTVHPAPSAVDNTAYHTLSTTMGEQYSVVLPDGSQVWLNAESSIKYPASFAGKKTRNVSLTGEGYFEITKDKTHPFIVSTKEQEVQVLGTHFNINSYADDVSIKTTLLEGSVKITGGTGKVVLKPNEQSVNTRGAIKVTAVDAADAIAWKNGEFVFDQEPLESIMKKISRWYNVEVTYKDIRKSKRFGGTVSRFGNVSDVLRMLELTGEVHFKIEGRVITVMP